jgi:hypothetical protein
MDLDAKTPPKAPSWTFGLLTDSNAGRCDCGITRASCARARLFPPSKFPLARRKIGLPIHEDYMKILHVKTGCSLSRQIPYRNSVLQAKVFQDLAQV